jgi:hypothetical protein
MQSGGLSVGLGDGLVALVGELLGELLAEAVADARFLCLARVLALAEGFEDALDDGLEEALGDAVGEGFGVGQTRASDVSLLRIRCASDSDSAEMPEETCSVGKSGREAMVMSLTSLTWLMRTPGTSACTPR